MIYAPHRLAKPSLLLILHPGTDEIQVRGRHQMLKANEKRLWDDGTQQNENSPCELGWAARFSWKLPVEFLSAYWKTHPAALVKKVEQELPSGYSAHQC